MGKKDEHIKDLENILSNYLQEGRDTELLQYLIENSNLPGRRANLELAEAFSVLIVKQLDENLPKILEFIQKLLEFSNNIAPTNDKKEFLAFCGTWALGALGVKESYSTFTYSNLRLMAKDERWRIREAVAKAITILAQNDKNSLIKELKDWLKEDRSWLIMRAIAAGMAESLVIPSIMKDESFAIECLEFHKQIFQSIQNSDEKNSEAFKALKKGLGFTLSVVVQAIPEKGFELIKNLIKEQNSDILWIINNNLKKNRLIKNFPKQVKEIKNLLK